MVGCRSKGCGGKKTRFFFVCVLLVRLPVSSAFGCVRARLPLNFPWHGDSGVSGDSKRVGLRGRRWARDSDSHHVHMHIICIHAIEDTFVHYMYMVNISEQRQKSVR